MPARATSFIVIVGWRRAVCEQFSKLSYAIVELAIGATALVFHPMFVACTDLSQNSVLPAMQSPSSILLWQWGSAALMIAPQSILLGMTFPLMSGGYLRVAPHQDGEILGGLYFTNSIGAAAGALAATFLLLPWVGMPGAIVVAGVINVLVGLVAWRVAASVSDSAVPAVSPAVAAPEEESAPKASMSRFQWLMLCGAAITGTSSFVYEVGWIRLLNQALGTTVHSFELMLMAFILAGVAGLDAVPVGAPRLVRDHLLMIAMLGTSGQGKGEVAHELERKRGTEVEVSNQYYWTARGYISAWLQATGRAEATQ